jgi:hypothetical protein
MSLFKEMRPRQRLVKKTRKIQNFNQNEIFCRQSEIQSETKSHFPDKSGKMIKLLLMPKHTAVITDKFARGTETVCLRLLKCV